MSIKYKFKNIVYILLILIISLIVILLLIEQYCRRQNKSFLEVLNPSWYEDVTKFPNDANDYKCVKNCDDYTNKIQKGYAIMKTKTLIIGGLCRNSADKIDNLKKRVEHLGSFYKDYRCIIFENDSNDGSRELLKKLCKKNNKFILMDCPEAPDCKLNEVSATHHGMMSQLRMKKMANYRNRLLEHIKHYYNDYDCVAFMDYDIKGPINMDGVAHSFGFYNEWDSISAYGIHGGSLLLGKQVYYDSLAYKDIDDHYNISNNILDIIPITLSLKKYKIGDKPFKVKSGFCGLAFYNMTIFNDSRNINYTPKDNNYICEHIILHNNMIEHGYDKIFINPNMTLLAGAQGNTDVYPFF